MLNISWQAWAVVALVASLVVYLVLTDDSDLYHYDDIDDTRPPDADGSDPHDPMSPYYDEQNRQRFDGRPDER